ncbi:hypothetical protein A1507_02975 [Methylomonas koyamae]|uniref:Uncharacterized protein n=1 Tax=Methylomonas koyamae TaxID=702114 RepID=A0A177P9D5_9GAMM|nr:hypothetical protein A1507_02975 [Methylomonas koyamae]OAI26474.1 hypothetical protein A1356_11080 [Methylomonas koyamae]
MSALHYAPIRYRALRRAGRHKQVQSLRARIPWAGGVFGSNPTAADRQRNLKQGGGRYGWFSTMSRPASDKTISITR